MAHQKYTTEAFILTAYDRIGADRVIRLFTEDAGLVDARAMGVREEKSKMRYALQPFSFVRVTLVRGKREWRITGAEPGANLFLTAHDRICRGGLVRIVRMLDRLVRGEEESRGLYLTVREGVTHIACRGDEDSERLLVLRMLASLGYVAPSPALVPLIAAPSLTHALADFSDTLRPAIDRHIEEGLAVSHL